ncbi:MAG: transcriptional regulator, partial [Bacteroidia bacterium]
MVKNDGGVNYIRHLLSISEKFIDDDRLSPLHISLYYALFQSWNLSKFRNPISVSRHEIMRASKIGSANTYTKCLKELDVWQYIKYMPSHNPHKGSQIYLYNFNNTIDNAIDISNNKSTNKTTEKTVVKASIPSINSLNNTNKLNNANENEHARTKNNSKSSVTDGKQPRKKVAPKKENATSSAVEKRPTIAEIENYFAA